MFRRIVTHFKWQCVSQSSNWGGGANTCAKRKSTSSCPLLIPEFDRIPGLYKRHLKSNREYAFANDFEVRPKVWSDLAKE